MSLKTAFSTAWKDLKKGAAGVASFVTTNEAKIQTVVSVGSAAVDAAVPALAPAVTVFDSVEEAIMGELVAIASDKTGIAGLETLSPTLASTVTTIKGLLATHPAVVAASTPTS